MADRGRSVRVDAVVITCEHGGRNVPAAYRNEFAAHRKLLESHRGWDPGALELARRFAKALKVPLLFSKTTRLLVELNRSAGHPGLFSQATRDLPIEVRQAILERYYNPYRNEVESAIGKLIKARKTVLHLSVHSFTPELHGEVRRADIGFLYDPGRFTECVVVDRWRKELVGHPNGIALASVVPNARAKESNCARQQVSTLVVRRNYPYRGAADGFTTYLRRRFPVTRYLGIELEVNQAFVFGPKRQWLQIQEALVSTLIDALAHDRRRA